jgi:hypothetical protein
MEHQQANLNGQAQLVEFDAVQPDPQQPLRYVLTERERALFLQYREAAARVEASMQGALQMLVLQQGLVSAKGFRLEQDCTQVVEQQ